MGEERVFLKDRIHRALIGGQRADVFAVEQDFSAGGHIEARDHAERSGLAAAGRAEQRNEFALADVQIHVVDDADAVEFFAYVHEFDDVGRVFFHE